MKKLLLVVLLFGFAPSFSQVGLVNQYHFNYLAINPALAGENGPFAVKGVIGNQFNGNLRFNQLSHVLVLDGQLYNKTGIAFQSSSDNYGVSSTANNFGLSFAKGGELGDLKIKGGLNLGLGLLPSNFLVGTKTRTTFNAGLGLFTSYKGAFLGVSKPSIYSSKIEFSYKEPLYLNGGYIFNDEDYFVTYNANMLLAMLDGVNNYDFNLKLWFNKRLALGGSYRINNIYPSFAKSKYFIPTVEYKFSKDLSLGLGYNTNTLQYSNTQRPGNSNSALNGIFQFYIKYNKDDLKGDSWYYDQF